MRWGWYALVVVLVTGIAGWLYVLARSAREAATAAAAVCPLKCLGLAFHNYHDVYGSFPPAYLADEQGRPMHSWRALILPFVEQHELYDQYRFDEPWDGPNNSQLADRMPRTFHMPSEPPSSSRTNIVAIVGEPTAFPGARATRLRDFRDGTEYTILLTEIADSDILWLEPRDLCFEEMSFHVNDPTRPSISCSRRRGPYIVSADGVVKTVRDVHPETLRGMATIDGGEEVALAYTEGRGLISFTAPPVTDDALMRFPHWPQVQDLQLIRTRITDAGLDCLAAAENLSWLDLSDTPISDVGLKRVAGLRNLWGLDLSGTQVTDAGLKHLTALKSLKVLDLSRTQITDEGLRQLAAMPDLTLLYVYETAVSEKGEAALRAASPELRIRRLRD